MKVANFHIKNSKTQTLLGVELDSKLSFNNHVTDICKKASNKLHGLSRVSNYMTFQQRKNIFASFVISQFGYCPLEWMFHSRKLNNRINNRHERALRVVYMDSASSFSELLKKDDSFTVHERNIQTLGIEMYKVAYGLDPKIMNLVFTMKPHPPNPWQSTFVGRNVKSVYNGTETLSHLGPKFGLKYLLK